MEDNIKNTTDKSKKRLTVGLLIDWTEEPYQISIFEGVADYAYENNINLLCFVAGGLEAPREYEKPRNVLYDFVTENNVDGIVVSSGSIGNYVGYEAMVKFCNKYRPIPLVSIALELEGFPSILVNNKKGMHDLINHLIEKHKYKKIAFIKGPENNTEAEDRYKAYLEALYQYGLTIDHNLVVQGTFELESGMEAVRILLDERKENIDIIIAANDNMALGALEELQSRNIKGSKKIAVVGFDDIEMGRYAVLPLTTVKQPLYEQGKKAVDMLVKLINNKKVNDVERLNADLIIRESCGCFSYNTLKAASNINYNKNSIGKFNETDILNNMIKAVNNIDLDKKNLYQNLLKKILNSFYIEIKNKISGGFLNTWNEVLSLVISKGFNISKWQEILSELRKNILTCISDRNILIRAEDLLQQARVMIGEALQRAETFQKILNFHESQRLREIAEKLMTVLDIEDQMNILFKELPKLGIKSCYLSLYVNPSESLSKAKLVLAFNNKKRIKINDDGVLFNSNELIPVDFFPKKKKFYFIIEELSDGNDHLGFVLFDIETKAAEIYEILRNRLSSALKASILIKKIRDQAHDLEEQVKERTSDLTKTNKKLEKEIKVRFKTEEKLKETLEKLENINKKLRSLSLKDELTGLYNRRGFLTLGEQHLKLAKRMKKDFLLFYIDLDGLKFINDTFGHSEGDYVLINTAEILKQTFRQADIVARLGGDEFTVLSVDTSSKDENDLRHRLQRNINNFNSRSKKKYKLSLSCGVTHYNENKQMDFEMLLEEADKILYEQKRIKKKKNFIIKRFLKK